MYSPTLLARKRGYTHYLTQIESSFIPPGLTYVDDTEDDSILPNMTDDSRDNAQTHLSSTPSTSTTKDNLFQHLSPSQAQRYASYRPSYQPLVISTILSHHTTTSGQLDTLLDIGCGPGTATRLFAPHFQTAIGIDPGESMLATARSLGGLSASDTPIHYSICTAEDLSQLVQNGTVPDVESVDLITAAMAAHWFDMRRFYPAALSMLKPGGTLAMWCYGTWHVTPDTPNAEKVNKLLDSFEDEELAEFTRGSDRLTSGLYQGLELPWEFGPDWEGWLWNGFQRLKIEKNQETGEYVNCRRVGWEGIKKAMGTMGVVIKWRAKYWEEVERREKEDVVDRMVRRVREVLRAGDEGKDVEEIDMWSAIGVVILKKKGKEMRRRN